MVFACCFSILPIRKYAYDLFILIHIAFAILFLIGMWYHLKLTVPVYLNFLYPCFALWGVDRFARIAKICFANASLAGSASYNKEADLIRVQIPVRSAFCPRPGTYYFIYVLHGLKPWESHPFTLSTWQNEDSSQRSQRSATFLIKPQKGATARLRDLVLKKGNAQDAKSGSSVAKLRLIVEGPYGNAHSLEHYHSVLFIIGGYGVTVALSHIQALHESFSSDEGSLNIRRVHLVWALRDEALFDDVYKNELQAWLTSPLWERAEFIIDIYVTRSHKSIGVKEHNNNSGESFRGQMCSSNFKAEKVEAPPPAGGIFTTKGLGMVTKTTMKGNISLLRHRPAISDIVLEAVQTWCVQGEHMALVSCGPATLADDTRAAAVSALSQGYDGLDFWPESFDW
ncbi:hypothetical protein BFJ63_vAg18862 [Fusarium oxysporum f. sp. narcissi]|uniref:FAD-binding FR-type domain-containing protein n=1 Tax=Fusarium oxysporum f. sp. narcissi TaxID=451672 RepID=A0A4Q2UWC8_FUSOX|nr:hypothetical protein BFJ63_vAg18862 [Fusarium oxysporum f. sp. narcissi]